MSEAPKDRTVPDVYGDEAVDALSAHAAGGPAAGAPESFAVPVSLTPEAEAVSPSTACPAENTAEAGTADSVAADEGVTELQPHWRADTAPSSPWPPVPAAGDSGKGDAPDDSDSAAGPAAGETVPAVEGPPPYAVAGNSGGNGGGNGGGDDTGDSDKSEDDAEPPMTLMDHLGELRTRLVRCLLGACVGFLLCYGAAEQLFYWLALPLANVMPQDTRLIYTSVPEGFFVYMKVAFVAGVFLASPYIFYQVWAFVAPGLYKEERRQMLPLSLFSAFFFIAGASFCYFVVFPYAFTFFMSYSTGMIVAMPSIDEYLGFSLKMLVAFGLIFEMPLFAFFLARMGVVTAAWMRKVRRYAILVVFVVAAILTPPDVISQMLMAMPMLILYEVSILVAAAVGRKEKPAAPEADASAGGAA